MRKINQSGMAHMAMLLVIVLLVVAGAGYYVYNNSHKNKPVNSSTDVEVSTTENLPKALPKNLLSVDSIKELATAKAPSLTIVSVELDKEDGVLVYKVKFSDDSQLFFNATTGAQLTNVPKDTETEDGDLPDHSKVVISFEQALAAAQAKKPDGTVKKIKLNGEHGNPVYKVTFTDGTKIFISGIDGSVIKTRIEGNNKSNTPGSDKGSSGSDDSSDDSDHSSTKSGSDDTNETESEDNSSGKSGSSGSDDGGSHEGSGSGSDSGN